MIESSWLPVGLGLACEDWAGLVRILDCPLIWMWQLPDTALDDMAGDLMLPNNTTAPRQVDELDHFSSRRAASGPSQHLQNEASPATQGPSHATALSQLNQAAEECGVPTVPEGSEHLLNRTAANGIVGDKPTSQVIDYCF